MKIIEDLESSDKLSQSLSRSRRTIRDLILCNSFEYFCTFTFNGNKVNRYNYDDCKNKILNLFANYKKRYSSDFIYLCVPEFHKDGAVHFHGVVGGIRPEDFVVPKKIAKKNNCGIIEMVPNTKKYVDWPYYSKKLGYFNCSLIRNYDGCARYVSKYISKDLASISKGDRVFFASANLNRPELVFDMDDVGGIFDPDFENDFCVIKDTNEGYGMISGYDDYGTFYDVQGSVDPDVYEYEPLTIEELQIHFNNISVCV